ncbi:hypothetical protein Bp8pS_059 [Bacillus phage vB_BpuM-BpSp]|nr:hypothetical protein Bp8pS_059 [Bacillus phage vB_BpuM-BpSp]
MKIIEYLKDNKEFWEGISKYDLSDEFINKYQEYLNWLEPDFLFYSKGAFNPKLKKIKLIEKYKYKILWDYDLIYITLLKKHYENEFIKSDKIVDFINSLEPVFGRNKNFLISSVIRNEILWNDYHILNTIENIEKYKDYISWEEFCKYYPITIEIFNKFKDDYLMLNYCLLENDQITDEKLKTMIRLNSI